MTETDRNPGRGGKRRIWSGEWARRLRRALTRRADPDALALRRARGDFARRYRRVCASCELLWEGPEALKRARQYMTRVLERERALDWWRENAEHADQAWFIWTYCVACGLAEEPPLPLPAPPEVIAPENVCSDELVRVAFRIADRRGDEGTIYVYGRETAALSKPLKARGFRRVDGAYERAIGEEARPILDRTAETAALLLERGFRVAVAPGTGVREMILGNAYAPEHRYWISATERPEKLRLSYPFNSAAHRYVKMAGGRWNGHYMEIDIAGADRLEELIERFHFRTTAAARALMDLWHDAVLQATIYHRQHGWDRLTPEDPRDGFAALLEREVRVLDELVVPDE